jgi:transcriptional regulator with XRE-family HTH domain
MPPKPVNYPELLKALRRRMDWSQHDMAFWLRSDQSAVSRWEKGSPIPGPATLAIDQLDKETRRDIAARERIAAEVATARANRPHIWAAG